MASAVTRLIFGQRDSSFSFVARSSKLMSPSPSAEKVIAGRDQVRAKPAVLFDFCRAEWLPAGIIGSRLGSSELVSP